MRKYKGTNFIIVSLLVIVSVLIALFIPDKKTIDFFPYSNMLTLLLTIMGLLLTITTIIYSSNNKIIYSVYSLNIEQVYKDNISNAMMGLHSKAKKTIISQAVCILIIIVLAFIDSTISNTANFKVFEKVIYANDIFLSVKITILLFTLYTTFFSVLTVIKVLDSVFRVNERILKKSK